MPWRVGGLGRSRRPPLRGSRVGRVEVVERPGSAWRLPMGLAAVAVLLLMSLYGFADNLSGRQAGALLPRSELPSVRGLSLEEAQSKLEARGYVVDVRYQPNEVIVPGQAFDQDPPAGAKVQQGDVVTVVVSDGPAGLSVPAVVGQQVDDASELLRASGLSAETTTAFSETVRLGEIMASDPESGSRLPVGGRVVLTVSAGPSPRTVPQVVGSDVNSALLAIGRADLGAGRVVEEPRPGVAPGTVLASSPPGGSQVAREYPVQLTVAGDPSTTTVPLVVGLPQAAALTYLASVGLPVQVSTKAVAPGSAELGRVVAQSLTPYEAVRPGTAIELTVAAVATGPTTPPPAAPTTTAA